MDEPKLRNCPFCGFDSPTMRIYKGKDGWRDRYTVICRYDEGGCGAEGGMYHSAIEAAEAWNRRAETEQEENRPYEEDGVYFTGEGERLFTRAEAREIINGTVRDVEYGIHDPYDIMPEDFV